MLLVGEGGVHDQPGLRVALPQRPCPSMSGLCGACNGGRRKLDEDADRATVGSLLSSGSCFSPKSPIA